MPTNHLAANIFPFSISSGQALACAELP